MDAKKIPIGSLIYANEIVNRKQTKVPVIVDLYILGEILRGNVCNTYEPIQLTEEWLLKGGFEKIKDEPSSCEDGEYTLKSKRFTVYKWKLFTYNSIHGWWINKMQIDINIKYVHHLQNLVRDIDGEELNFKL